MRQVCLFEPEIALVKHHGCPGLYIIKVFLFILQVRTCAKSVIFDFFLIEFKVSVVGLDGRTIRPWSVCDVYRRAVLYLNRGAQFDANFLIQVN